MSEMKRPDLLAFSWAELGACLEAVAGSAEQAGQAVLFAEGLAEKAPRIDRLELLEMVMTAAYLVQAEDPSELVSAARALQLH